MSGLHIGAFAKRKAVVASEIRMGKGANASRLIGANGEINASSKADLMAQQTRMMQLASTKQIVTQRYAEVAEASVAKAARREAVQAMFNDPQRHMEIGADLGDELYITQQREGIMRNVLQRQEVVDGQIPRIVLRNRNLLVGVATGPTATELQVVRDNWLHPVEYYLTARPYIEQKEITQNSSDVLEDKYLEAMQAFLVGEDRIFRDLCQKSAGQANNLTVQVGMMNPTALGNFRNLVTRWGLTASQWLIANDLWVDITSDAGFQSMFEPMAQHEIILTGQLGTVLGMTVKSDAYRHPEHKVLSKGEQYIFGTPDTLGTYTDRGGIDVVPIDAAHTGVPGRGWHMTAQQSQTLGNFRAVAVGRRED